MLKRRRLQDNANLILTWPAEVPLPFLSSLCLEPRSGPRLWSRKRGASDDAAATMRREGRLTPRPTATGRPRLLEESIFADSVQRLGCHGCESKPPNPKKTREIFPGPNTHEESLHSPFLVFLFFSMDGNNKVMEESDGTREAWAAEMRIKFSPRGMTDDEGTINQTFFFPRRVSIISEEMRSGQPVKRELHATKKT